MKSIAVTAAIALTLAACQRQEDPSPAADAPPAPVQAPVATPPQPIPPAAAPGQPVPPADVQATDDWRDYAKPADVDRLDRLDAAWTKAREGVKKDGDEAELARLGALADPTVSLPNPHPAPGLYRCRTIKVGGMGLIAYGWFRCEVELTPGGDLILNKLTGSQRSTGLLYPGEGDGLVFLGAQAWGATELKAPAYGAQSERDQVGLLERIGDQRWRLAMPWPRVESDLDLMEIAK